VTLCTCKNYFDIEKERSYYTVIISVSSQLKVNVNINSNVAISEKEHSRAK